MEAARRTQGVESIDSETQPTVAVARVAESAVDLARAEAKVALFRTRAFAVRALVVIALVLLAGSLLQAAVVVGALSLGVAERAPWPVMALAVGIPLALAVGLAVWAAMKISHLRRGEED